MTSTRIKEKLSSIVRSQLPEFVQSDYSKFVRLLEIYYEFLEQDQGAYEIIQNAQSYNDVDRTTAPFLEYFIKNYAKNVPLSAPLDKRLLVKKIGDFYEAKGSELSFKFLFNLLYNADISVSYPYENVLRASAGRWEQKYSLHVTTVSGDRDNLLDRNLVFTSNTITYVTPIIEVINFNSEITEVFLDPNFLPPQYNVNDIVSVTDGANTIFTGQVSPTLTGYEIENGGGGFKKGQIFYVSFEGGDGTSIQLANVSNTGAITEVKFLTYGGGYAESNITLQFSPTSTVAVTTDGFFDKTKGFKSAGNIFLLDPTDPNRYFLNEYASGNAYTITGNVQTFENNVFNDVFTTQSAPPGFATIKFIPGSLGRYPGAFTTNESFISESEVRLEDEVLYQPFAYLTETSVDYNTFFEVVKQLIHPAGQKLVNNRLLTATINLLPNVTINILPSIDVFALDTFDVVDNDSYVLTKPLVDSVDATESKIITLNKPVVDSTQTQDNQVKLIQPIYSDNVVTAESLIISSGILLSESQAVIEQIEASLNKPINNTANATESIQIILSDFFAEDYVSEIYAGSVIV